MRWSRLRKEMQRAQARAEAISERFFLFPKGKTDIRVLPAASDDDPEAFYRPLGRHFDVVPGQKFPFVCRNLTDYLDEPCPICELAQELRDEGRIEEADKISVRKRYLVRALVRKQEEKGAQVVECPSSVFMDMAKVIVPDEDDEDDESMWGDVLDVRHGRDFRVEKTGDGKFGTNYKAQPHPKTRPILPSRKETMEVVSGLCPIAEVLQVPSYDELKEMAFGEGSADDDKNPSDMGDDAGGDWNEGETGGPAEDGDDDWGSGDGDDEDEWVDGEGGGREESDETPAAEVVMDDDDVPFGGKDPLEDDDTVKPPSQSVASSRRKVQDAVGGGKPKAGGQKGKTAAGKSRGRKKK